MTRNEHDITATVEKTHMLVRTINCESMERICEGMVAAVIVAATAQRCHALSSPGLALWHLTVEWREPSLLNTWESQGRRKRPRVS